MTEMAMANMGQYAHGNQPIQHMIYLYNYAGQPWKTQELVHKVMNTLYHNSPDGLSGNEDCGQMSAWYVFSALGFYPVSPGSPTYTIGRPLLDRVSIDAGVVPFVVEAVNNKPENRYIQSITWNNAAYTNLYITQEMINSGGILRIEMGPLPQAKLLSYHLDLNDRVPKDRIAAPYFLASGTTFGEA